MSLLTDLARGIQPYVPGEQPKSTEKLIKLNTNENPYPPAPEVLAAVQAAANESLRLYPDPSSTALREAIAKQEGLLPENVFVGNGSDEVLAHSFPAFFVGKQPIRFADITYSFYSVYAQLYQTQTDIIPLTDALAIDVDAFCRGRCGGVLLPNPNAPTGTALPLSDIERILKSNAGCVVLVDEAYVEFGAQSAASLIGQYDNLLVVRTLSKSHALAGMRLGYALAQPALIDGLTRIKDSFNSYPIDRVAQAAGTAAMQASAYYRQRNDEVMQTREAFSAKLKAFGFDVLPSSANFVFASPPGGDAKALMEYLRSQNILMRYFDKPRIRSYLRITIGTPQDMDTTCRAIEAYLQA